MKLTTFLIKFDNPQGVFEAGKNVCGHVVVNLAKPMKIRSLTIHFSGDGKSFWDVRSGKHTTKYRARESYLSHTLTLCGAGQRQDGSSMEHPAGNHVYPFSFCLMDTVPMSFEGRRGYVRYTCVATIDRPWKFDSQVRKAFTVIHHLDLNRYGTAMLVPIYEHKTETIQGCCCDQGTVEISMELNKSGYVPGEPIAFDIDINNKSDNAIETLELQLQQVSNYTGYSDSLFSSGHPKYHTKQETFNLFSGSVNVDRHTARKISRAAYVPSLPPSILDGCKIIDIKYYVELKIASGWSSLKIIREVMVGTIPVHAPGSTPTAPPPVAPPGDQVTPAAPVVITQPPTYEDSLAPPPSYAECVFGRTDIRDEADGEHTSGDMSFAPAYPYYDWSQHSTQTYGGQAPSAVRPNPPSYDEI